MKRESIAMQATEQPLLTVRNLRTYFSSQDGILSRRVIQVKAVDDISFDLYRGETLGLVGESGCGKTTAGRTIIRLIEPSSGEIWFQGRNILTLRPRELRNLRHHMQIVFQDPYASLNPRMKIGDILEEPFLVHGIADRKSRKQLVRSLLEDVGLSPQYVERYPHEFSGGQRQRIGIARALAPNPSLIICDEPVSSLDVSIQSQVINLLKDLQEQHGLSYLFISHDLAVVKHLCDRVAVMYLGEIVELAQRDKLFSQPLHPYTEALMYAVPLPNPKIQRQRQRIVLQGDVPSALAPPTGCHFHTRCPYAKSMCREEKPELLNKAGRGRREEHYVACHFADELELRGIKK